MVEQLLAEIYTKVIPLILGMGAVLILLKILIGGTRRRSRRRRTRRYGGVAQWTSRHEAIPQARGQQGTAPEAKPPLQYRYRPANQGLLLTPTESIFYGALKQAVGNGLEIHAKVRVADVLEPGVSRRQRLLWGFSFNKIKAKHFDFVLCDSKTLKVELVIELNDRTHQKNDRRKRDAFLEDACEQAGVKLLFLKVEPEYAVSNIKETIGALLNPPSLQPESIPQC